MKRNLYTLAIGCLVFAFGGCKNKGDAKEYVSDTEQKTQHLSKQKWHWGDQKNQNETAGYAQVVKAGNTIYISGVPTSDLSAKGIESVYKALEQSLNAFGATSKNVVKETLFTTDIENMKKYNEARKAFYKGDFPAATWVQVSRFFEPDSKLEIELIAQLPDSE